MSSQPSTEAVKLAQRILLSAIEHADFAAVRAALKNGVNPNVPDPDGLTALMWAAKIGAVEMAELLLDNGADLERTDSDGWTALAWATSFGCTETIRTLLARGANPHQKDRYGVTVLMRAASEAESEVVEAILDHAADLDARDRDGDTAFMWAVRVGRRENVEILIQRGANVSIPDQSGETSLIRAVRRSYDSIADTLLADGHVDINARNIEGWTALMFSVFHHGGPDFMQKLLDHGADLTIKNKAGDTAERIAFKACCLDVIPLLVESAERADGTR